jgi:hypothetical protein
MLLPHLILKGLENPSLYSSRIYIGFQLCIGGQQSMFASIER